MASDHDYILATKERDGFIALSVPFIFDSSYMEVAANISTPPEEPYILKSNIIDKDSCLPLFENYTSIGTWNKVPIEEDFDEWMRWLNQFYDAINFGLFKKEYLIQQIIK